MRLIRQPGGTPFSRLIPALRQPDEHPWLAMLSWLLACVFLPLLLSVLLSGCWGGGGDDEPPKATASAAIGPAGGTLIGPDGVELVVPAGALTTTTTLTITRTSDGAPALDSQWKGSTYEFTPHGLAFGQPVTIRLPAGSNIDTATSAVLMASPGQDWSLQDAQLVNGKAEFQRNQLSWGLFTGCAWNPGTANDPALNPESCFFARGGGWVSAQPSAALTDWSGAAPHLPGALGFPAQPFRIGQATQLSFSVTYSTLDGCLNSRAKLMRVAHGQATVLQDVAAPLSTYTPTYPPGTAITGSGGGSWPRARGTVTFAPITIDHTANGQAVFLVSQTCNGPISGKVFGGSEQFTFQVGVPVPTVTYTIGGNVSGLAGTGLTLQNNGTDTLAISADGAFTFPLAVGAGAPYAVTVASQPNGQTCSISNGSGTAGANVSNVAVTCMTGRSWKPAALLENSDAGYANLAEVAMTASGDGMVIWSQYDGSSTDIWARRYTRAGGWATAQRIETASGFATYPHVSLDTHGNAVAVWSQQTAGVLHIFANRFDATSGLWATAVPIEAGTGNASSPRVAHLANGDAIVVWSQGSPSFIRSNRLVAGAWVGDQTISPAGSSAYRPQVAALGNGAEVVWVQAQAGIDHILHNHFDGTGWGTADILSDPANTNGLIDSPQIASDGSGRALVVWSQSDGSDTNVYHRLLNAGVWDPVGEVDTAGSTYSTDPRVAMNASGQAVVGWKDDLSDYGQAWLRSWAPGSGWSAAAPAQTTLGSDIGDAPSVAIDPSGNAIAVWAGEDANREKNIYAAHRDTAGVWGLPVLLDNASDSAQITQLAIDASGNAIALWNQNASGQPSVWSALFK